MPALQRGIQQALSVWPSDLAGLEEAAPSLASVSLLLGAGGDRRIWTDAVTGRNRYGTKTTPAGDEISFASTTASNVSAQGHRAADLELRRLFGIASPSSIGVDQWFGDIRRRILAALHCEDAEIVLAASGTDVELIAVCLVAGLSERRLTNILIAPDETGSGVPRAAAGCHYADITALGTVVEAGTRIDGLSPDRIDVRTIAIRDAMGRSRSAQEIDADLIAAVEQELQRGNDVLLHVLDTSKTGLTGVTREAARYAAALAPGRVHVIVDACQFRCSSSILRQDLADGFLVAVTGSKFIAGPPFAGAILMPSSFAKELATAPAIPAGLADYTAALDWSAELRARLDFAFQSELNLGLGLRWIAALAHLEAYEAVGEGRQHLIKSAFAKLVRSKMDGIRGLVLHPEDDGEHLAERAVVPLTTVNASGAPVSFEEAQKMHLLMRELDEGWICHMGQAVRLGSRTVLRIAASAPDIIDVSVRMDDGEPLNRAMRSIEDRLDILFHKWDVVQRHLQVV